jgi:hypothetical protein
MCVSCWEIEKRANRFFATGKVDKKPARKPRSSPADVVIVGAGAAGSAAAAGSSLTTVRSLFCQNLLAQAFPNRNREFIHGRALLWDR